MPTIESPEQEREGTTSQYKKWSDPELEAAMKKLAAACAPKMNGPIYRGTTTLFGPVGRGSTGFYESQKQHLADDEVRDPRFSRQPIDTSVDGEVTDPRSSQNSRHTPADGEVANPLYSQPQFHASPATTIVRQYQGQGAEQQRSLSSAGQLQGVGGWGGGTEVEVGGGMREGAAGAIGMGGGVRGAWLEVGGGQPVPHYNQDHIQIPPMGLAMAAPPVTFVHYLPNANLHPRVHVNQPLSINTNHYLDLRSVVPPPPQIVPQYQHHSGYPRTPVSNSLHTQLLASPIVASWQNETSTTAKNVPYTIVGDVETRVLTIRNLPRVCAQKVIFPYFNYLGNSIVHDEKHDLWTVYMTVISSSDTRTVSDRLDGRRWLTTGELIPMGKETDDDATMIFVRGVDKLVYNSHIKKMFKKYGTILSVRFPSVHITVDSSMWMYALIVMETKSQAQKIKNQYNGRICTFGALSRTLEVRLANDRQFNAAHPRLDHTLLVQNLPREMCRHGFVSFISGHSNSCLLVNLARQFDNVGNNAKRSAGFGYVTLRTREAAVELRRRLDGRMVQGNRLTVRYWLGEWH